MPRLKYICEECGVEVEESLDICADCSKDFDGDGMQPATEGNNTCVHCGCGEYDVCCPECRTPLHEEEWDRVTDSWLATAKRGKTPAEAGEGE